MLVNKKKMYPLGCSAHFPLGSQPIGDEKALVIILE